MPSSIHAELFEEAEVDDTLGQGDFLARNDVFRGLVVYISQKWGELVLLIGNFKQHA